MESVETRLVSYIGRIRDADPKRVSALADSIKEVGLLNPISVYKTTIVRNGSSIDGFGLIAGMHRLRACQTLGWADIPAVVLDLDEQRRVIAECDENLCVNELSPSDRALFTARRKQAYEQIHPETVRGVAGAEAKHGRASDNLSFAQSTAEATGKDARTVQRDAERGEKVCNSALALVKGTHLDTGRYLDQLKGEAPEEQVRRVKADLARRDPVSTSRQSKIDADVKDRAARAIAEFIAANSDGEQWDGLKADLYAAGAKNIADALSNITGNSLGYRGAAE